MYTAGYDARVLVKPSTHPYISWQWTKETERYFEQLYNSVMHPTTCNTDKEYTQQAAHSIRLLKQPWGLGSRIRDTVDVMLAALDVNRTVLHAGTTTACPFLTTPVGPVMTFHDDDNNNITMKDTSPWHDPYMNCLYQPFSSCQGLSPVDRLVNVRRAWGLFHEVPGGMLVPRRRYQQGDIDAAIGRWWNDLLQNGLYAVQYSDPATATTTTLSSASSTTSTTTAQVAPHKLAAPPPLASLDEQYSVIRAIMAHQVFSPSKVTPWVQKRVKELEEKAGVSSSSSTTSSSSFAPPTLVVHLRRTDKANDEARIYPHEQRPSIPETLVVIRALIRASQRLSGLEFQSIFFMSDEPQAFQNETLDYLSSTLPQKPTVFFNDFVSTTLGNHSEYTEKGHEYFLNSIDHDIMDHELVASMTFAAQHASYVVGYGRSGVSQLLAQLIGAKHRICPSQVSLFEDDMVLLKDLEETKDWYWFIEGNK